MDQIVFLLAGFAKCSLLFLQIWVVAIAAAARPSSDANLFEALASMKHASSNKAARF